MTKISLSGAVASILGKKDHEDYQEIGQLMGAKDLYTLIGLTGSPMLYNYMSGKTKNIEPERAKVFLDKFDLLIDLWDDPNTLRQDCTSTALSKQIAYEPIKGIIDYLVELEKEAEDNYEFRRGIRKLIVKHY